MPVLLARRDPHRVASLDLPDRPAPGLHAPNTQDYVKGLAKWVGVPCRSGTGLKGVVTLTDIGRNEASAAT